MSAAAKARAVFDTNAVLSALLFTYGRLSWLVGHWQARACVPLISRTTAEELTRILAYPKFRLSAGEAQLLALVRGHWVIENSSHWVRDVTYDEDRSQIRSGTAPRMMAILRNLAIAIVRGLGFHNVPQGLRHFARRSRFALAVLGL